MIEEENVVNVDEEEEAVAEEEPDMDLGKEGEFRPEKGRRGRRFRAGLTQYRCVTKDAAGNICGYEFTLKPSSNRTALVKCPKCEGTDVQIIQP